MKKLNITNRFGQSYFQEFHSKIYELGFHKGQDGKIYPSGAEELKKENVPVRILEELGIITTKDRLIVEMREQEEAIALARAERYRIYLELKEEFEESQDA